MKAALFDLDGTLLDSLGMWTDIDREFFSKRNLPLPVDYQASIRGMTILQTAKYTVQKYLPNEDPFRLMEEWDKMCQDKYQNEIPLKKGAYRFLAALYEKGIKLAVATTLSEKLYVPALKRNRIYHLFTAFSTTDETKLHKSEGTVYLLTSQKLGCLPQDCSVFEDIPEGIAGAKKVGMKAYLVKDIHHANEFKTSDIECDGVIDDFSTVSFYF